MIKGYVVFIIFTVLLLSATTGSIRIGDQGVYKDGQSFWHEGIFSPDNYLPLDGTNSMVGNISLSGNSIQTDGNISIFDSKNNRDLLSLTEGGPVNITGARLNVEDGEVIANNFQTNPNVPTYLNPSGRSRAVDVRQAFSYYAVGGIAQNNWYRLDQQNGVTVTVEDSSGNTWTDPANLFNNPGSEFQVNTANMPVNITMDFGGNEHYNDMGGIGYRYGRKAKDIKIRVQRDDGTWFTHLDKDDYMGNTQIWPSWGSHNQKFRIILSDPSDSAISQGYIRISNLFNTKSPDTLRRDPGGALVYAGGDNIYGNMDHNGNDINNVGTLNANTKNFVQQVNQTHEVVYTSQESPMPRAVVEGTAVVKNYSSTVKLPEHFRKVVSDSDPDLKVQATPYRLAKVAVTRRSKEKIKLEADEPNLKVDYRITGIREGLEDKVVVRRK